MGNLVSSSRASVGVGGGRIVMSDGSIRPLDMAVSVAELMLEHPRHFVVDARLLTPGAKKVAPLPADHVLDTGGMYVVLPATRGKVSADEARRVLTTARSLARSRSMPALARKLPSFVRKSAELDAEGSKREDVAVEPSVEQAVHDGFDVDHRPEFLSRELSSRGWKPSLRTIEEKVLTRKSSHWLF